MAEVCVDELSRALTPLASICRPKFSPVFNEVDLVGLVVRVEEGTKGSFLTMFITDESSFVVRLLVWDGRGPKDCFKVCKLYLAAFDISS